MKNTKVNILRRDFRALTFLIVVCASQTNARSGSRDIIALTKTNAATKRLAHSDEDKVVVTSWASRHQ